MSQGLRGQRLRRLFLLAVMVLSGSSIFAQTDPPPPPPPPPPDQQQQQQRQQEEQRQLDRENARREAEREAQQRRLEQERRKQLDKTLDAMGRMRPPTPEERRVARARFFPDFIKKVEKLNQISFEMKQGSLKEVRRKANEMEDLVDDLLEFILDGEKPPPPPDVVLDPNLTQGNVNFLFDLNGPLVQKLVLYIRSERQRLVINVNLIEDVVRELQIAKLVSGLLKR